MKPDQALISPPVFDSGKSSDPPTEQAGAEISARPEQTGAEISSRRLARCSTAEARMLLPYEKAAALRILPLGIINLVSGKRLSLATVRGLEREAHDIARFLGADEVHITAIDAATLQSAIFIAYKGDHQEFALSALTLQKQESASTVGLGGSAPPQLRQASGDAAKFLISLIDYAIAHRASDLQLIPGEQGTFVTLRVDGVLRTHTEPLCTLGRHAELISRLKVLCSLDIAERRLPQDGCFDAPLAGGQVRQVRLGIMPTIFGERASLRFHGGLELRSLNKLGLLNEVEESIYRALNKDSGLILFSGPTGSGKSTTMYAALEHLHRRGLSVLTVEDPVEQKIPWASQTSLDLKAGLDYPKLLRAALRHDPDAILIGEIRDRSSAEIALQAAETGHLVVSSVHARCAEEVCQRLTGLGLAEPSIIKALSLVIFQRILPALCAKCRVFDLAGSQRCGYEVFRAAGCGDCESSGYAGRLLVASAFEPKAATDISFNQSLEKFLREGSISLAQFAATRLPDVD